MSKYEQHVLCLNTENKCLYAKIQKTLKETVRKLREEEFLLLIYLKRKTKKEHININYFGLGS